MRAASRARFSSPPADCQQRILSLEPIRWPGAKKPVPPTLLIARDSAAPTRRAPTSRSYDSTNTPGSTAFRSLAADDVAGVCAVYPAQTIDPAKCNVLPRHGFSTYCAESQTEGSCAMGPGRGGIGAFAVAAIVLAAACARRRRAG